MENITTYEAYYNNDCGWTNAFAKAIDKLYKLGGGQLNVPAGVYDTYPIELKSNITLHLEAGAELRFIQNVEGYPLLAHEFAGRQRRSCMPCIYAKDAENVTLCGQGKINGQGEYWWEKRKTLPVGRPRLIQFDHCRRVKILDVMLINSPNWTVHPCYCEDVEIRGITIRNPWDSPNTDGINPESCKNVRIADCLVDVGDDCITIKAGTEETLEKAPCENITITNCNIVHGHGGVVIGSEMSGGVKNVVISNCVFQGTDRGIRVKTRRGRGGTMESILIDNVIMDQVVCPFVFNMYYRCGAQGTSYKEKIAQSVDATTPVIRNIQIQNCMVTGADTPGFFYGLPEMPIENVTISNCTIRDVERGKGKPAMMEDLPELTGKEIFMCNTKNVQLNQVQVFLKE